MTASNDTGFQPPDLAFDFEVVGQDQCERPDATPLQCSPIAPCPVGVQAPMNASSDRSNAPPSGG